MITITMINYNYDMPAATKNDILRRGRVTKSIEAVILFAEILVKKTIKLLNNPNYQLNLYTSQYNDCIELKYIEHTNTSSNSTEAGTYNTRH